MKKVKLALTTSILLLSLLCTACSTEWKFGFSYKVEEIQWEKGKTYELEATIQNISGKAYQYEGGYSDFAAEVKLYCETDGTSYVMTCEDITHTTDIGTYTIEHNQEVSRTYCFEVPDSAPEGTYDLELSYKDSCIIFEDVVSVVADTEEDVFIEPDFEWVTVKSYQTFYEMKKLLNEPNDELVGQRLDELDNGSGALRDKEDVENLLHAIENREVLYLDLGTAPDWKIGSIRYVVDTGFFDIIYSNGQEKIRIGCSVLNAENKDFLRPEGVTVEQINLVQLDGYDMELYPLVGEEDGYTNIGNSVTDTSYFTMSMWYRGENKEAPLDETTWNALKIATIGEFCDEYQKISDSVSQEENPVVINESFEELLSEATHVVLAECIEEDVLQGDSKVVFVPMEVLRGEMQEDTFILRSRDADGGELSSYKQGEMYILILDKMVSVYEQKDYYLYSSVKEKSSIPYDLEAIETQIQESDAPEGNKKHHKNTQAAYDTFASYIREYSQQHPHDKGYIGEEYIDSSQLNKIVKQTDIILKVKITEHWDIGNKGDREMCFATVTETLKGEVIEGQIQMILFKDRVEAGAEYIVMLDKPETANFYIPSAKNSIFSMNDLENVSEIYKLLDDVN